MERLKLKALEYLEVLTSSFKIIPHGILLVIILLLTNKIERKEIYLYFFGAVLTGSIFSTFIIEIINDEIFELSKSGETVITSIVTILGFLSLIYIIKNEMIQELINKYFKDKLKKDD